MSGWRGFVMITAIVWGIAMPGPGLAAEPDQPTQETPHKRFWPRGAEWRQAAHNAFADPGTWAPAGAAAVIAIGGWDRHISDWASTHTPVFGSIENAETWSDRLRAACDVGMVATALSVQAEEHPWRLR